MPGPRGIAAGIAALVFVSLFGVAAVRWLRGTPALRAPELTIRGEAEAQPIDLPMKDDMVRLPGGRWLQGTDQGDPDARPPRPLRLSPFWIDRHEVTNGQFTQFVDSTGYVTLAERQGFGRVFDARTGTLKRTAGADWRAPQGPGSTVVGRGALPVTQVAFADAAAYADWAGKRLPSEAEFEYAARAGLLDADFPWGGEERPGGRYLANYWQGHFPLRDAAADGFAGLSAIGAFPPNRYGLFDLAGNVREWCGDWYAADAYQISSPQDPRGPDDGRERVVRGGSWLSAAANGGGICVWRRDRLPPDWMDDQTGFRCAKAIDGRPQREPPGGRL